MEINRYFKLAVEKLLNKNKGLKKRRDMHWIQLKDVREFKLDSNRFELSPEVDEMVGVVMELGYFGEGSNLLYDKLTDRFVLMNNFYEKGHNINEDNFWKKVEENREKYDLDWAYITYPPCKGNYRSKRSLPIRNTITKYANITQHRGTCLWISWKKN